MPGFITRESTDQWMAEQIQITNGIQHFMLDKFIIKTQAVRIDDTIFVHHNGVIQTPTQRQPLRAHGFYFLHKTESAGTAHLLDIRMLAQIHHHFLLGGGKNWMGKVDGEA